MAVRNRVDDRGNYPAPSRARTPAERRRALARAMTADVLALMAVRERLARVRGLPSYVDLVLASEDWEPARSKPSWAISLRHT